MVSSRIGIGCLVGLAIVASSSVEVASQRDGSMRDAATGGRDSTLLVAGARYHRGAHLRFWLGDGYRDLWTTPIKVPIFELSLVAGGLVATRVGGGLQTRSLHLQAADGRTFVFRPVRKDVRVLPEVFRGTPVEYVAEDALSQSHPAAPLLAPPFLRAAGLLHAAPVLGAMPNDERLGAFRREFAGQLGMLEEYPSVPAEGVGFGGAIEIIDSAELLWRMSQNPRERVDARVFLAARLMDGLLNDNDRHERQWKWARLSSEPDARWLPIPRDRDRVLVSYEGALHALARLVRPDLVRFEARYPEPGALNRKSRALDARLLGGLERAAWDSIATALMRAIDDSVIETALHSTPPEYWWMNAPLRAKLRARRDSLGGFADRYRRELERAAPPNQ